MGSDERTHLRGYPVQSSCHDQLVQRGEDALYIADQSLLSYTVFADALWML